jgi:hypothetical protein
MKRRRVNHSGEKDACSCRLQTYVKSKTLELAIAICAKILGDLRRPLRG